MVSTEPKALSIMQRMHDFGMWIDVSGALFSFLELDRISINMGHYGKSCRWHVAGRHITNHGYFFYRYNRAMKNVMCTYIHTYVYLHA